MVTWLLSHVNNEMDTLRFAGNDNMAGIWWWITYSIYREFAHEAYSLVNVLLKQMHVKFYIG